LQAPAHYQINFLFLVLRKDEAVAVTRTLPTAYPCIKDENALLATCSTERGFAVSLANNKLFKLKLTKEGKARSIFKTS